MCYEWYEESLLDAAIWQSKEKAEKKMAERVEPQPTPKEPVKEPLAA
ncbi:MAG: hypothetical protein ACREV0_06180 [Burkholderiales bacterium]